MQVIEQVQRISREWRHPPPMHVVPGVEALPLPCTSDTAGLFYRGQVYIVDGQTPERTVRVLGHEIVGHHGLRVLHGRRAWATFMSAIAAGARGGDPVLARCRDYVRAVYTDDSGLPCLRPVSEADEAAALIVELHMNPQTGVYETDRALQKRLRALAGYIGREALFLDLPATFEEVEGALKEAEQLLRHGRGLRTLTSWCYAGATMPDIKPMGANPPPRDLAESQWLLDLEKNRLKQKEDTQGALIAWGGILSLIILVICVVGAIFGFLEILTRPWR